MTQTQKLENEKFFEQILRFIREGGTWIWPDQNQAYRITQGKFEAQSKKGFKALQEITTQNWFSEKVIQNY